MVETANIPGRLWAILMQRCPRCFEGSSYSGFVTMREACPVCGWRYEREPGYFTGAMYASYTIGFAIVMPVWLIMLLAGASFMWIMIVVVALLAGTFPLMFRYSRVLWMHFDVFFNGTGDQPA